MVFGGAINGYLVITGCCSHYVSFNIRVYSTSRSNFLDSIPSCGPGVNTTVRAPKSRIPIIYGPSSMVPIYLYLKNPRNPILIIQAPILKDDMNPKIGVIYPLLLEFLLRYMNHKPF